MRDILSLVSSQSPSNARERQLRPLKRPLTAGDAEAPAKVHPSQRYTNSRGADRGTDQAGRDIRTTRPTKAITETRAARQAGRGQRPRLGCHPRCKRHVLLEKPLRHSVEEVSNPLKRPRRQMQVSTRNYKREESV